MIYIIQCLCANRHAILAVAYDEDDIGNEEAFAGFRGVVKMMVKDKAINPWCGICHSRIWTYEQERTKFRTLEEAQPELEKLQAEQKLSRLIIDTRRAQQN